MALSKSVEESLKEAEQNLRNALAFAARQEKPYISKHISRMICDIDGIIKTDELMDKLENRLEGDSGRWGLFGE
jgi:hypothetical protein